VTFEILSGLRGPRFHEKPFSLWHPEENSTLGGTLLVLRSNRSLAG